MHPDNTVVCQVRRSRASVDVSDDEEEETVDTAEASTPEATQE
jgi:large subunit ribosomal protein L25